MRQADVTTKISTLPDVFGFQADPVLTGIVGGLNQCAFGFIF